MKTQVNSIFTELQGSAGEAVPNNDSNPSTESVVYLIDVKQLIESKV